MKISRKKIETMVVGKHTQQHTVQTRRGIVIASATIDAINNTRWKNG